MNFNELNKEEKQKLNQIINESNKYNIPIKFITNTDHKKLIQKIKKDIKTSQDYPENKQIHRIILNKNKITLETKDNSTQTIYYIINKDYTKTCETIQKEINNTPITII